MGIFVKLKTVNDNEKTAKESINKIYKLLDEAKIDNNEIILDVAPSLTCYYMSESEEQKQFCENLIKEIKDDDEDIKTEIKTSSAMNFSIELNFKGMTIIENDFDSCKNSIGETIDKIYDILGQNDEKDSILILLCFIEKGNEEHKNYCLNLFDKFKCEENFRFQIDYSSSVNFYIQLIKEGMPSKIQNSFDKDEKAIEKSLNRLNYVNDNKFYFCPKLICYFEQGNEEQKEYCLKLKDNFYHEKMISYTISSGKSFSIFLKINTILHQIHSVYKPEEMEKSLDKMYSLLDENYL